MFIKGLFGIHFLSQRDFDSLDMNNRNTGDMWRPKSVSKIADWKPFGSGHPISGYREDINVVKLKDSGLAKGRKLG